MVQVGNEWCRCDKKIYMYIYKDEWSPHEKKLQWDRIILEVSNRCNNTYASRGLLRRSYLACLFSVVENKIQKRGTMRLLMGRRLLVWTLWRESVAPRPWNSCTKFDYHPSPPWLLRIGDRTATKKSPQPHLLHIMHNIFKQLLLSSTRSRKCIFYYFWYETL